MRAVIRFYFQLEVVHLFCVEQLDVFTGEVSSDCRECEFVCGASVRINCWLRGRVAYVVGDIVNDVCPYCSPPLRVGQDAAFSQIASNCRSSAILSGILVMQSMSWSFLGKPSSSTTIVGAVCSIFCSDALFDPL